VDGRHASSAPFAGHIPSLCAGATDRRGAETRTRTFGFINQINRLYRAFMARHFNGYFQPLAKIVISAAGER
jgi:hypothetical protein